MSEQGKKSNTESPAKPAAGAAIGATTLGLLGGAIAGPIGFIAGAGVGGVGGYEIAKPKEKPSHVKFFEDIGF